MMKVERNNVPASEVTRFSPSSLILNRDTRLKGVRDLELPCPDALESRHEDVLHNTLESLIQCIPAIRLERFEIEIPTQIEENEIRMEISVECGDLERYGNR